MKRSDPNQINTELNPNDARQGDVLMMRIRDYDGLIVKIDDLPPDLHDITPKNGPVVLQYGEMTGHKHAFYDRGVQVFARDAKAARPEYLRVVKTALLKHEEHSPATLPPGLYRLPTQVEHSDAEEPIVVAD